MDLVAMWADINSRISVFFGSAVFGIGSLNASNWIAIAGLFIAMLSLSISWYYKNLHYKLTLRQLNQQKEGKNEENKSNNNSLHSDKS